MCALVHSCSSSCTMYIEPCTYIWGYIRCRQSDFCCCYRLALCHSTFHSTIHNFLIPKASIFPAHANRIWTKDANSKPKSRFEFTKAHLFSNKTNIGHFMIYNAEFKIAKDERRRRREWWKKVNGSGKKVLRTIPCVTWRYFFLCVRLFAGNDLHTLI